MKHLFLVATLVLTQTACGSQTPVSSEASPSPSLPIQDTVAPQEVESTAPEAILQTVLQRSEPEQACGEFFNPEDAQRGSEIFVLEDQQYLVQLMCFMAAYQGNFQYLLVSTSQDDVQIQSLELEIAGFPTFDPQTKALTNTYKFTGAGTCLEETEHRWNGQSLELVSKDLVEGIASGCDEYRDS